MTPNERVFGVHLLLAFTQSMAHRKLDLRAVVRKDMEDGIMQA
jgi:hypothetical protein